MPEARARRKGGVGGIPPRPGVPPSGARRFISDFALCLSVALREGGSWICVSDLAELFQKFARALIRELKSKIPLIKGIFDFRAPRAGIEPATVSLTASRSTAELPGNISLG